MPKKNALVSLSYQQGLLIRFITLHEGVSTSMTNLVRAVHA